MSDPTYTYKTATQADAPAVHRLIEDAFRAEDPRPGWTGDVELAKKFRFPIQAVIDQINKPHDQGTILLVINEASTIVGAVMVTKKEGKGRFHMIAVDQKQQQAGLGRKLLAYAEKWTREQWNVSSFALNAISPRTLLIQWYERRGFVKIGTSPCNVKIEGQPVPEDWYFVEMEKPAATAT